MSRSNTRDAGEVEGALEEVLGPLNAPQREAVLASNGPVLILAGAGSGKTRTITHKIAYLVNHCGLAPWEILAVTFTNRAAAEMRERSEELLGHRSKDLWMGTFHAIGLRILRRHAELLGRHRGFVIYDADDQLAMVKRSMKALGISEKLMRPRTAQHFINDAKRRCLGTDAPELDQDSLQDRQCMRIYAYYEKGMVDARAVDFTDLLLLPLRIVQAFPMVAAEYKHRWRYILVDEFQDTNQVQFDFIRAVLNDDQRICVVGDDDQSIYRWRGADVSNILDFPKIFPGTTVIKLEQNYRSSANILRVASSIIRSNTGRHEKTLWTERDAEEKVRHHVAFDDRDEATWVATRIQRLSALIPRREIAIFYRTNAQSRPLEDSLRRARIPYKVVGGLRFYERMEIKNALAYLKVIVNPHDSVGLERIINVPPRGIGKTTVGRILGYAHSREISMWEATRQLASEGTNASRKKLLPFVELIEGLRDLAANEPALVVAAKAIERSGYMTYLAADETPGAEARVENLKELLHAIEDASHADAELDLGGFLEQITLSADIDVADMKSDQVALMTGHSAKGLEFDVVFVTGMEEGLMPHFNSMDTLESVEEERRLCYVAVTRARKLLHLVHATERRRYGVTHRSEPSRFLRDIPQDILVRSGELPPSPAPVKRRQPSHEAAGQWGDYSQAMPSYEDESQDESEVGQGARVFHPKFGAGTVLRLHGTGENGTVEVRFSGNITKKILARFLTRA